MVPLPPEGQDPEGGAEAGDQPRGEHPAKRLTARSHGQGNRRCHQCVERHEQVAQPGEGQHRCGSGPTPAGLEAPDHEADVDEAGRHGQREGELAGHGRHQVAAHDVERPVEHERQGGHGGQRRAGEGQTGQAPRQPSGHRHDHQATDRHPLQRHAVVDRNHQHGGRTQQGQPGDPAGGPVAQQACRNQADGRQHDHQERRGQADVHGHDQQHRDHHVEVVGGEPGVPVGRPPGEAEPGQQLVADEGRSPDVGAQVAAGRGGPGEEQAVRVDDPQDEQDAAPHEEAGHPCGQRDASQDCHQRAGGAIGTVLRVGRGRLGSGLRDGLAHPVGI